jgi:hypothetical protein
VNRHVSRAQAAQAAGVPYQTLAAGKWPGAPTAKLSPGRPAWSVPNVLAVRVARILEERFRCKVADMRNLFDTLWKSDEAELRRLFREGRKYAMIVGRVVVGGALFTESEISANEMIDYEAARAAGMPLPAGLNIENEYNAVVAAMLLDSLDDTPAA